MPQITAHDGTLPSTEKLNEFHAFCTKPGKQISYPRGGRVFRTVVEQ